MFDPVLLINIAQVTLFNLPNALRGVVFSSIQYSLFAMQHEYLRGDNGGIGLSIGSTQAIMANILMFTLTLAFPALSVLRPFYYISWAAYLLPGIAGFTVGGYKNIRERLVGAGQNEQLTGIVKKILNLIQKVFEIVDSLLNLIPPFIARVLSIALAKGHKWFGLIFFTVQFATMAILTVMQPWVGIPGLVYTGMYVLKAKGFLPRFAAKAMEKLDYWVSIFAGLAIGGLTNLVLTTINLVIEFVANIIIPKVLRWKLDQSTDILRIEYLTTDVAKRDYQAKLPANISLEDLNNLLNSTPELSFNLNTDDTFETQMDAEIHTLWQDLADYAKQKQKYRITAFKSFLDQLPISKGKGLGVTLSHMSESPFKAPVAPKVDFTEFNSLVAASDLSLSVNSFKAKCLNSSKFWTVSAAISADRLESIGGLIKQNNDLQKDEPNNRQQIRENNKQIAEISKPFNAKIIRAHGEKLGLPSDATEDEIIIAFVKNGIKTVCSTINDGSTLYEKRVESVEEFQNKGRHVAILCKKLLESGNQQDLISAHDMLGQWAIDAADFCATGNYDVINKQYMSYVEPELIAAAGGLSPRTQILMQLQNRRQQLFDMLYHRFMNLIWIRLLLIDTDPSDIHMYNSYVHVFESFNIPANFNAKSDLSVQKANSKTRLFYGLFAYFGARLMMSLDTAYSPTGIVSDISKVNGESSFNAYKCCLEWAQQFAEKIETFTRIENGQTIEEKVYSGAVYDKMEEILYYGSDSEKRKLLALMLYDFDIFSTNGELTTNFTQILANPTSRIATDNSAEHAETQTTSVPIINRDSGVPLIQIEENVGAEEQQHIAEEDSQEQSHTKTASISLFNRANNARRDIINGDRIWNAIPSFSRLKTQRNKNNGAVQEERTVASNSTKRRNTGCSIS